MHAGGRLGVDYMHVLNGKVASIQPPEILELDQLGIVTKKSSPLSSPGRQCSYRRAN